ncbi:MAG: efflux RND transporter periplasmic adaptor subunit [Planctomycetes bacterium]|nr:efflux RND transporter periplasmic adaptor subunit [Planctomycetota bacterium]
MENTTNQKRMMLLLAGVVLLGVFSGCSKKAVPKPAAPEVTVAQPLQKNVRRFYDLTGNTEAVEAVDIRARVEGFLEKVHFEDGADVTEGDVLFTIEQDLFVADVEQAKAVLESAIAERHRAQADLDRVEMAVKSGAVSEQEVDLKRAERDIAVASVAQAEASLTQAELQLSYTTVTSPVSGRVSRRFVDKGNLVGSGEKTLLTRVVRFDPIYVYSNISETLMSQILKKSGRTDQERREAGAKLFVGLSDEDGYPHEGVLNFIDNRLDATTGTVQIRGTVPNEKRLLYPGMFVRLRIPSLTETESLLVYEKAIGTDLGGKFILIVGQEDNVVERRYVKLGQLYEDMRVIKNGLEAGERYIYKGIQRARPGLPVTPKEEGTTNEHQ